MKTKLLLLLFILPLAAIAQCQSGKFILNPTTGRQDCIGSPVSSVANLPPASTGSGTVPKVYVVYDGANSADCTTGLGSFVVFCITTGASWAPYTGGGSFTGGTPGGATGTLQYNAGGGLFGGFTPTVNSVGITTPSALNFLNSAAFNGLTATFANPSAGGVQLGFTGTLNNAGLTNSTVIITPPSWLTGGTVALGATLTITPTAAQTSHQVIGTCGSGTTFAPCALVAGDLPAITAGSAPQKGNGSGGLTAAVAADIVGLFSTCSGTQYLGADGACHAAGGAGATAWSALTDPTGNLALTMAARTTLFTFNAATGASDLFKWTDTASNTGTGTLGRFTTASGSGAVPWQADANGVGWKVDTAGKLASVGATTTGAVEFTGITSGNAVILSVSDTTAAGSITIPGATDTLVGKATTDVFTNKTYDTAGTGNSFLINGLAATANTGTGAMARAASPTFTGTVTTASLTVAGTLVIPNNSIASAQLAVVNTRRTVCLVNGANNAAAALVDGDLGPQSRQYMADGAWTLVQVSVAADAGTPNIIVGRSHAGTVTNVTSAALATAASGGIACSNTGGTTGLDGVTTCSATLQNTAFAIGDWVTLVSGTAGGTAKEMTACATFTVN